MLLTLSQNSQSRRLVLLKSHPVRIERGGFGDSSPTKQDSVNQYEYSQVTMLPRYHFPLPPCRQLAIILINP